MSKMIVARKPCGCITAIEVESYQKLGEDVLVWLQDGDVVRLEEHDRLGFERCEAHQDQNLFG